jgi:hypothetical protein
MLLEEFLEPMHLTQREDLYDAHEAEADILKRIPSFKSRKRDKVSG